MGGSPPGVTYGCFLVDRLLIISSGERRDIAGPESWEHVSVSHDGRCPTWAEMAKVKDAFWREDELVLQFHPPKDRYVDVHPFCLHLWKSPHTVELPPARCV
jgi:hypothetical protein